MILLNMSDEKMKELMELASKNMGISMDQLQDKLKNQDFNDPKINELLKNPDKLKNLLQQPGMQAIINKFFKSE